MIILIIIIQYGTFQISFPDSWLIYNDYIRWLYLARLCHKKIHDSWIWWTCCHWEWCYSSESICGSIGLVYNCTISLYIRYSIRICEFIYQCNWLWCTHRFSILCDVWSDESHIFKKLFNSVYIIRYYMGNISLWHGGIGYVFHFPLFLDDIILNTFHLIYSSFYFFYKN